MSVEKIVEKILSEAQTEADRTINEAKSQAEEIRRTGKDEAERARKPILDKAHREAERRRRMHRSLAELDTRNRLLATRRELLDQVFAEVNRRLAEIDEASYKNLLQRLIVEATETGTEQVVVSAADRKRLGNGFLESVNAELKRSGKTGALDYANETREINGGVVLKGENYEINVSFATLLRGAQESLEAEVARMLFAGGDPDADDSASG
ncbi:MAG: V-type ATP synthase subunit E [Candidatus Bipolaricaulia bacterium]